MEMEAACWRPVRTSLSTISDMRIERLSSTAVLRSGVRKASPSSATNCTSCRGAVRSAHNPDILVTTARMHEIVAGEGNGYVLLDSRPPHELTEP